MPMYYFNLKGCGEDREGDLPVQFASLEHAKADLAQSIRETIAATPGEWQFGILGLLFEICDEDGEVIDIIRFQDAVYVH